MKGKPADRELRRQITLRMRGGRPNRVIFGSATRIARTFRSRLCGQFVEDEELLALSGLPFAREVPFSGGQTRSLNPDLVRREMAAGLEAARRQFEQLAGFTEFETSFETFGGAIADLRELAGILALGEPLELAETEPVRSIMQAIAETPAVAGLLVAGARARRSAGPVVALLEPGSDIATIVDTAERIGLPDRERIILVNAGTSDEERASVNNEAADALDRETKADWQRIEMLEPRSFAFMVNQLGAGLLIVPAAGSLRNDNLAQLIRQLECPLLLLR